MGKPMQWALAVAVALSGAMALANNSGGAGSGLGGNNSYGANLLLAVDNAPLAGSGRGMSAPDAGRTSASTGNRDGYSGTGYNGGYNGTGYNGTGYNGNGYSANGYNGGYNGGGYGINGPMMPSRETSGANTGHVHISTAFVYTNSYWFRYQDVSPNTLNLQNFTKLDVNLNRFGDVYLQTFVNFASNIDTRYINGYGTIADRFHGDVAGPMPSSDFQEVDFSLGYHYKVDNLVDLDSGLTMFITPTNVVTVNPQHQVVATARGQSLMQEFFIKGALDDSRFLGKFALHPYVFIGFDYSGSYNHNAGQYYQLGVSPVYNVPNSGGLEFNPYANVGFISGEKLLDRNLTTTRDGYLGVTVGVRASYPLNPLLGIPRGYGTYRVGGYVEYVQAGSRYQQPTGNHSGQTVAGVMLSMSY